LKTIFVDVISVQNISLFGSHSWNTEDFVNRVDQAHRLNKTTTALMSTASAKQIALYSYTTVPLIRSLEHPWCGD